MSDITALEQLNSVKYVYLREISEPDINAFNTLRIVVEEAVINYGGVPNVPPGLDAILKGAHPIESVEGCKSFQLYWRHYLAYLVTEELIGSNAPNGYADECYTGSILRVYTKSHFRDHIARNTGGHIKEVHHFKLVCLDHLIDVASYFPPEIEVLASERVSLRTQ